MPGREVAELVRGDIEPGEHTIELNAEGVSSGVYYYRLLVQPTTNAGVTIVS